VSSPIVWLSFNPEGAVTGALVAATAREALTKAQSRINGTARVQSAASFAVTLEEQAALERNGSSAAGLNRGQGR
jgi:hypothetical protein